MPKDAAEAIVGAEASRRPATEVINGRYTIVRCLGKGGMGDVYLVKDGCKEDLPLALKRVRQDKEDSKSASVLRSEYLSLVGLPHPNLVRAFDFGVDQKTGDLFYTAEYVDGVDCLQVARSLDLRSPAGRLVLFEFVVQVLRALEFIHGRGLVHCDIKPENLLVSRLERNGSGAWSTELKVKIIDFGLAREERTPGGEKILGTPYYVAPETILGSQIDRRADLYSLGVVLYQLVTGRPPFVGESNLVILKSHVERQPRPPQEVVPGLPEDLGALVLRLMEKKPEDRFQSAIEALDHMRRIFGLSAPLETAETYDAYLQAAALVGREREQETLRSVFLASSRMDPLDSFSSQEQQLAPLHGRSSSNEDKNLPRGRLVLVRGEKGLGQRRLMEDLRQFAQTKGARYFEVRCKETAETRKSCTDELLEMLARLEWPDWPSGVPVHIQSILMSTEESADQVAEEGLLSAADEVAHAILESSREQPIVLHFCDVHMASKVVARLLAALVRHAASGKVPGQRLSMVATATDMQEAGSLKFECIGEELNLREYFLELRLSRFDEEGLGKYLRSSFPGADFPESFRARVFEESDGNLDAALEILRYLLGREKIRRCVSGWELSGDYEEVDFPGKDRGAIKERLSQLPEEALRVAVAFACLGDGYPADLALELAGIPSKAGLDAVELLVEENILDARSNSTEQRTYSFVHGKTRVILYALRPPQEMRVLHGKAGLLLEARLPPDSSVRSQVLAHHFLRAGDKERGSRYGLEAARKLAAEPAPMEALQLYDQVLALLGPGEEKLATTLRREMATVTFQVSDYRGVLKLLGSLPTTSQGDGAAQGASPIHVEAARAHMRLGHFMEASALLEAALRFEGKEGSAGAVDAITAALAELHYWKGENVQSLRYAHKILEHKQEITDLNFLCQLHSLVGQNLGMLHDFEGAIEHFQAALRLVDSQHDNRLLARSLFLRGKYYSYKKQYAEAVKQFRLCLILHEGSDFRESQADCLYELGALQLAIGRISDSRSLLEEALALYQRSDDVPRSVATLSLLGEAARLGGDQERCHLVLKEALQRSGPLDKDRITMTVLLSLAGYALDLGDISEAMRHASSAVDLASNGKGTQEGVHKALLVESQCHVQMGRYGIALAKAEKGLQCAREAGEAISQAKFFNLKAFIACSLGKNWEARRALVSLHDIAERHAFRLGRGWARVREGTILRMEGKFKDSLKLFAEAREIFNQFGGERDTVDLQLEHGITCLEMDDFEQAYLNLEEGLHIATRLHLPWHIAKYQSAMGRLESIITEGEASRAESRLLEAERICLEKSFLDPLWRVQLELGRLLAEAGSSREAEAHLASARETIEQVLDSMPEEHRESYCGVWGAADLLAWIEEKLPVEDFSG